MPITFNQDTPHPLVILAPITKTILLIYQGAHSKNNFPFIDISMTENQTSKSDTFQLFQVGLQKFEFY